MNQTCGGRRRLQAAPRWPRPRRAAAPAAALATVLAVGALLATACSSASAPALASETVYQKALAYSQCMRAHGEPDFPDPQANGSILINGPSDHLNGQAMSAANKACQHLLPKSRPLTGAQQRRLTTQALKFVACMRAHGLPNTPDPQVNSGGIEISLGGAGAQGPGSPVVKAAQQACHKLIPGGPP